jgi:CRP-like cAMP-binding protein
MCPPEEIQISQGDLTYDFYLIAKGQCDCYVQDETRKERFVSLIGAGAHFGEISILTGRRRTATI